MTASAEKRLVASARSLAQSARRIWNRLPGEMRDALLELESALSNEEYQRTRRETTVRGTKLATQGPESKEVLVRVVVDTRECSWCGRWFTPLVLKTGRPSRGGLVRLYVSARVTCRAECKHALIGWNRSQNLRMERENDPEGFRRRTEELAATGRRARTEKSSVKKLVNLQLREGEDH